MRRALISLLAAAVALSVVLIPEVVAREGVDQPVRTTRSGEVAFSRSDKWTAWTKVPRRRPGRRLVMADRAGRRGDPFKVDRGRGEAIVGNVAGSRVVYQQFTRRRSSIRIMNLETRERHLVPGINTRHWEYFPKMSSKWLLFARQKRSGRRLLLLRNLNRRTTRVLARGGARTYFGPGQVNGKWAVWMVQRPGSRFRVVRYNIKKGTDRKVPGRRHHYAPSVTPRGTVYFGRSGRGCGTHARLVRWTGRGQSVLRRFRVGNDFATTFVYRTDQGRIQVFHDKINCDRGFKSSDVYRFGDPFTSRLRVRKDGNGNGVVRSRPPGIRCGNDCRQYFERGERVTLIANPAPGDRVQNWSVDRCERRLRCRVRIEGARTVTVTFQ